MGSPLLDPRIPGVNELVSMCDRAEQVIRLCQAAGISVKRGRELDELVAQEEAGPETPDGAWIMPEEV